jgi:hypothetical protein
MAPSTAQRGERFRLTLRALPGSVPANPHRLKRLLKCLLRGYGFRCERIEFPASVPFGQRHAERAG